MLLLDTHAFLWAIQQPELLSAKVRDLLLDPEVERWVSVASFWEIAAKVQIGKLSMPAEKTFYVEELSQLHAKPLPIGLRHTLALFDLPLHHRDPFDRLLIAQAREDGLTLVTRDDALQAYDVETLW